ncbi:glycoside hydrolase family 3 N-terminal domain-containing protein [Actinacidiphila sp. ITFR-21]|uniref:glycoside hydrolase family 3 N-terminal domain-containing protein n=1 Tax=Actinacidiphila sp. ITFR-21 TaxID=3075199 RepID=UPI002889F17D|nr:glycoside hydrolase family 3 N-terminal domain-containing protein [Streptomyces sp. ITFR-21]WNI19102.1 glycoside hydrolase family 3 N-terminal domain-containing protein [Streptomyces sp. ITFR-21]
MNALHRLATLVDSCLLPSIEGRHGTLPDWLLRGLERGTPGAAVHAYGPAARATTDAVRAALPDALTGHPGPRRPGGGSAAAAELVTAGANLHLGVRPGLRADETRVFVTDLQTHGVAGALGPFTGAGSLRPFAEGAAAGVRAITAGHTPVPDADGVPAALSAPAITGILRGELGYGGVVVSDALDAPAIVDSWGVPGAAVLAWIAGVDLLRLGPASGEGVREAIHTAAARAVFDGDLPVSRLEEAAERVARLRRWACEPRMPTGPIATRGDR